jgi:hypothetical protein
MGSKNKLLNWDALRSLHGQLNIPRLVLGYFNEILFNYEKEGGPPRSRQRGDMQAFHDGLDFRQKG